MQKIKEIEQELLKKDVGQFNIGDQVRIMIKIKEADEKLRLQPFEGTVIAKNGSGLRASFTVRKVSYGEGIERVFSLHSPSINSIEVVRKGKAKRSKLYYLRKTVGQAAGKIEGA